jgi:CRISPR type IV-associated protein Csf3
VNWHRWGPLPASEPMRVEAVLAEPLIYYGDGLHLDGVLSFAKWRDFPERVRRRTPPIDRSLWAIDFRLPLERVVVDEGDKLGWVWACSAVHALWLAHTQVAVRKRPAIGEMTRRTVARGHHTGAGPGKAHDLRFPASIARILVWYARGDVGEVRRLLETHIRYVGKKTAHGNGRVLRWTVTPTDEDRSVMWEGELLRRMPRAFRPDMPAARGAIRAPYHHASRIAPCVDPVYSELRPA